jgi:hypothetical protein
MAKLCRAYQGFCLVWKELEPGILKNRKIKKIELRQNACHEMVSVEYKSQIEQPTQRKN